MVEVACCYVIKYLEPPLLQENKSLLGYVSANNEHIDQVFFVYYPDGKSFTGEEMIEITFHGNVVWNKILDDLIEEIAD